jgi:hypothetical protein
MPAVAIQQERGSGVLEAPPAAEAAQAVMLPSHAPRVAWAGCFVNRLETEPAAGSIGDPNKLNILFKYSIFR